ASLDGLTGCLNRSALIDLLDHHVQRAHNEMRQLGFVALDLDHFKQVNDTFGHLAGDELLMTLGVELRNCVRDNDIVGRVGGDEFAVIVPDADEDETRGVAERVRRRLQAVGASMGVDVSLGLATLYPHDDGRDLRQRADEALYVSKGTVTRQRLGTARLIPEERPSTQETSVY
ncbi:MAG: response regulator receiver modulated diguanylate cyclase, partial [Frankiales bacterium]|nr:response regulator receiver modulated diguanylate cyclase [Frankiales bacterium]